MKKVGKVLLILILCIVGVLVLGVGFLTAVEFRPAGTEGVPVSEGSSARLEEGQSVKLLTWNVGYGALGAEADFFMDGGKHTRSADRETVERYLSGIAGVLKAEDPELVLLQEVDADSSRSYRIDQRERLALPDTDQTYAKNYSVPFVPYPMPPLGRVQSGLFTMSRYEITAAERIALPCPFSWPIRTVNLKRCLLVNRLPVGDSGRELVLVDLHLEAYDSGEGKIAQTRQLTQLIEQEYEKGNWVIAGGDFNQVFPGSLAEYPIFTPELWMPGIFESGALPEGFIFVYDLTTPTCRLLNKPYDPQTSQHYVIDGFILSPNVRLESMETLDLGFEFSDHNPVRLQVTLEK